MVYRMVMYVDGGCRRNGYPDAVGAATCIIVGVSGRQERFHHKLPSRTRPTSQRAEVTALILALVKAVGCYNGSLTKPYMDITIYTDIKYAHGCITNWVHKWVSKGWRNAKGREFKNRDLIEKATKLDNTIMQWGKVNYIWVPRSENADADELCNEVLDGME